MRAAQFLSFFTAPDTFLEIRVRDGDDTTTSYHTDVSDALARAKRWDKEASDVYFGVCPRNAQRGKLEDVALANSIWADLDTKTHPIETLFKMLERLPLPPSVIVESGNGLHVYWLLAETTADWKAHEAACTAISVALGGDSVGDRSRVLRIPSTRNWKHPSDPKLVRVIQENTDYRYHLQDFLAVSRLNDERFLKKLWSGDSRGYPSRSERDFYIASTMVRVGFSDNAIENVFRAFPVGERAASEEKYLSRTIEKARAKSKDPGQEFSVLIQDSKEEVKSPTAGSAVLKGLMWDFVEGPDDCLYFRKQQGSGYDRIATFVFIPTQLLKGDGLEVPDVIAGRVRSAGYEWERVLFSRKAFTRVDAMLNELPIAAWQWLGTDKMVKLYLPYLMEKLRQAGLPHTRAVNALGRHGDVWVGPETTISSDEVWESTNAPLVYYARHKEKLQYKFGFCGDDDFDKICALLRDVLPKLNEPDVIWPIIGWFFATQYKPALNEQLGKRFPILNLFGTRGCGKTTTLMEVFLPLTGNIEPVGRDSRTTRFVLLTLLGSTTSLPLAFTEFRKSLLSDHATTFLRYLLISYDSGQDARGRPDQSLVYYPLTAPFSVDGEDQIPDAAAKERVIAVDMHPEAIAEDSKHFKVFESLKGTDFSIISGRYVQFTLQQDLPELWESASKLVFKAFPMRLAGRVRNNITVVAVGILSFCRFTECEVPNMRTVLSRTLGNVVDLKSGRTTLLVDDLVEDVVNAVALGVGNQYFHHSYRVKDNVLWFNLTTALNWWHTKRRREGGDVLENSAMKQQCKERIVDLKTPAVGQYMVAPKGITVESTTKWMHGVDIQRALGAGLDVPETLKSETELVLRL